MRSNNLRNGFTIVEMVIAVAILSLIGGALMALMAQIASANNSAVLRARATAFAEQSMEDVRAFKTNGGYSALTTLVSSGTKCYSDAVSWTPADCTAGNNIAGTPFYRLIKVTNNGNTNVYVSSKVMWTEKRKSFNTEVDSYFYDY